MPIARVPNLSCRHWTCFETIMGDSGFECLILSPKFDPHWINYFSNQEQRRHQ